MILLPRREMILPRSQRGFFTLPAGAGIAKPHGSGTPLLLDTYSGAVGAWSVSRKLRSAATLGLRLRTDSDTNPQDIGFSGTDIDEASITSLYSGGSQTAVTEAIYDQSTSGIDLYQSSSSLRPSVLVSGTLQKIGGRLAAIFAGSQLLDTSLTTAAWGNAVGLSGNALFSVFIVHRKTTSTGGCLFGWGDTGTALEATGYYDDGTSGVVAFAGGNSFVTTLPSNNTHYLTTIIKTAGAINTTTTAYRNGSSVASTGHSTNTPTIDGTFPMSIGQWASFSSNRLIGSAQELIVFSGDKSSDRSAIESDIMTYYSI
jgi:hypothetical protein